MKTLTSISPDIPPAPPRPEDREHCPRGQRTPTAPSSHRHICGRRGAPLEATTGPAGAPHPSPPSSLAFQGAAPQLSPEAAQSGVGWAEAGGRSVTRSLRTAGRAFSNYLKHGSLVSVSENTHFIIFISSIRTQSQGFAGLEEALCSVIRARPPATRLARPGGPAERLGPVCRWEH